MARTRYLLADVFVTLERFDEAVEQYQLAADAGNHWSMCTLGRWGVYADEDADLTDGITWLERAAEAGNEDAAALLEGLDDPDPVVRARAVRERLEEENTDE